MDYSFGKTETTLVIGKVTGFRWWMANTINKYGVVDFNYPNPLDWDKLPFGKHSRLCAFNGTPWKVDGSKAQCEILKFRGPKKHKHSDIIPHIDCSCGFYGYYSVEHALRHMRGTVNYVFGAYEGWGKILLGETGFKSQYVKITALAIGERNFSSYVNHVGRYYKVPVFDSPEKLKQACPRSDLSNLIPKDVRKAGKQYEQDDAVQFLANPKAFLHLRTVVNLSTSTQIQSNDLGRKH